MADLAGAAIGAALGSVIPGVGWQLGMSIGSVLGSAFMPKPSFEGGKLSDLKIGAASQAAPIPIVFGTVRTAGNIIWAPDLHESSSTSGGGGSLGGPTFSNTSYTADLALMVCEGEITRINKIWADAELLYDYNGGSPIWAEYLDSSKVDMYTGTMVQTVNDVISAERVAAGDLAPAYLGRAYVVFEGFPWSRFGHTPNFTFEVVRGAAVTLDDICSELLERMGIVSGEIDMTALSGVSVAGWMIPSRMELVAALSGLLQACNADLVEVDGKIKGVLKNVAASFALTDQWLGCSTDGDPPSTKVETVRTQELELPKAVDVTYLSQAHDHQQFTQRALRRVVESQGEITVDIPLVMTEDAARRYGETILHERWIKRMGYSTSWPLLHLSIAPGDVGTIPVGGQTVTVRVEDQTMGVFGHILARLTAHDNSVYTQYVTGATPPDGVEVSQSNDFTIWVRDLNAFSDPDADYPMLYGAASRKQSGWPGFIVESEIPMYAFATGIATRYPFDCDRKAVLGWADTVLASGTPGLWDRTNTVDVTLVQGSLTSATEAEVLEGANMCAIGDEILQFATATLIGVGDEIQTVTLTGGTTGGFTLKFRGAETASIAYNASTAAMQTALQALSTIGSGNVTVSGAAGAWVCTFASALANTSLPLLEAGGTNTTGGTLSIARNRSGGGNQYRLSTLLRGRRGTENYVGVHGTTDPFILVDSALEKFAFTFPMRDGESDFYMQSNGLFGPTVDANIVTEVLACKSRWPYSPVDVRGERDGSNNLTITWKRRSRKAAAGVLAHPALDEASELYEIDVMNGSTVVRTITATTTTASYTALQQTGDFGSAQSSLTVRVYQVSPGWIRGHKREAVI